MTSAIMVRLGDVVRYTGHPDNSGFETGEICVVVAIYHNSIACRRASGEKRGSYYVSNGDFELIDPPKTQREHIAEMPETIEIAGRKFQLRFLDTQTGERVGLSDLPDHHWENGNLRGLTIIYEED